MPGPRGHREARHHEACPLLCVRKTVVAQSMTHSAYHEIEHAGADSADLFRSIYGYRGNFCGHRVALFSGCLSLSVTPCSCSHTDSTVKIDGSNCVALSLLFPLMVRGWQLSLHSPAIWISHNMTCVLKCKTASLVSFRAAIFLHIRFFWTRSASAPCTALSNDLVYDCIVPTDAHEIFPPTQLSVTCILAPTVAIEKIESDSRNHPWGHTLQLWYRAKYVTSTYNLALTHMQPAL